MVLIQLIVSVFLLIGLVVFCFYLLSDFWASIKGAPFVPTKGKLLKEILDKANLKKGQNFLELGSGDGRIIRFAVKNYGVKGVGIDINYPLVKLSQFLARSQKLKNIELKRGDLFKEDFSRFDVIFLFLMPNTIKKLTAKFIKESKKGSLLISHGFEIKELARFMVDKTERSSFSTFYYKIK